MKLPMKDEHEYLTKEKFEDFKHELEILKTKKRKEIAEALEYAKSLGDLSENAEYHEARDAQAQIEDRINRIESLLKSASIISSHDTNTVTVGSIINVERIDGSKATYTLVGSEEADASTGKISTRSPLGESVFGKKKGESFSFQTQAGTMTYKVIDIK